MIWHRFPVGLRFPVTDESIETRRRCWAIALSALAAAPAETYEQMQLYDVFADDMPGSAQKEYVCILDHDQVTQSRVTTAVWRSMARLYGHLSLHFPFYQANALPTFAPYPLLGNVLPDGTLERTEDGLAILPERLPAPMQAGSGKKVLVAGRATPGPLGWAARLKEIGLAAAERDDAVSYLPYADGGVGTTYAVTLSRRGRFEWIPATDTAGEKTSVLLGILPYATVLFDAAAVLRAETAVSPACALGTAVRAVLDRGYRRLLLPIDGFEDRDDGAEFFAATDERYADLEITILTADAATASGSALVQKLAARGATVRPAWEQIDLAAKCREADAVLLAAAQNDAAAQRIAALCAGKELHWIAAGETLPPEWKVK